MKSMISVLYLVVVLGLTGPAFCENSSGNVVVPAATPAPTLVPAAVVAPTPPGEEQMIRLQEQMAMLQDRAAELAEKRAAQVGHRIALSTTNGFAGGGAWYGDSSMNADRAWIVPSEKMKLEEMDSIQEDMTVMSHILDKALDQADLGQERNMIFIGTQWGGGSGSGRSLFLAGYGALFRIDVDFPLAGPAEQPKQEPVADKDPTWAKARREIYEPAAGDSNGDDEDKYKPEKVDALKKVLVESLKHASNIRALQAADKVVILVSSRRGGPSGPVISFSSSGKTKAVSSTGYGRATNDSTPATILVVQAKKADIDALAGGTMTLEQFKQKVLMTSY